MLEERPTKMFPEKNLPFTMFNVLLFRDYKRLWTNII